jgi:AcrR family transcriptional regulator
VQKRVTKQASVRRAEIVDIATELFAARGVGATTVAEIIDAAGIAKGGFYHHFASKDEVFAACVDRLAAELATAFADALEDSGTSPRDRIRAYLRLGYADTGDGGRSALLRDLHSHRSDDLHARVMDQVQDRVFPGLLRAIAQGRADDEFHFLGDPEVVTIAVSGMLRALHERYAHVPHATQQVPLEVTIGLVEQTLGVATGAGGRTR